MSTVGALLLGTAAQAATYTYVGGAYDNNINNNSTCNFGPCETFAGQHPSGSFTTATTLAPGTYNYSQAGVTSYSFTDGAGTTYTNTDPQTRIYLFTVTIDASGTVTTGSIILHRFVQNPESVIGVANPPGDRFNRLVISPASGANATVNLDCLSKGFGPAGAGAGASPAACTSQQNGGSDQSNAGASTPGTFSSAPVVVVAPVPTLGEWGMVAMAFMVGLTGLGVLRRRKYF